MRWRSIRLRRLVTTAGGSWGTEPEEGDVVAHCVRGTDFDYSVLRVNLEHAPLRGFRHAEFRSRSAHRGDMIVEKSGGGEQQPVGRVVLYDGEDPVVPTNFAGRLRPMPGVDPRFMCYLMASLYSQGRTMAAVKQTTGIQNLDLDALLDDKVSIPAETVQRAIADYLDCETARIDALTAARRRMVELLEEHLRAERIARVIDRDNPVRQDGPSWLGSIPCAWRLARLKFVARMDSGHTPNKQVDAYWVNCTIPWITLNDVSNLEDAWRFFNPKNAVNELGLQNSSAHVLPADAVVMSRDATVGRSAILGRPMAVSQHFVAWICGTELLPEYLLNVIRGPMQNHFGSLTAGATIATIGMPDLNQLVVPLPSIAEQVQIVKAIAEVEDIARRTISVVNRQIALLRERRQALITATVTGELDIAEAL